MNQLITGNLKGVNKLETKFKQLLRGDLPQCPVCFLTIKTDHFHRHMIAHCNLRVKG